MWVCLFVSNWFARSAGESLRELFPYFPFEKQNYSRPFAATPGILRFLGYMCFFSFLFFLFLSCFRFPFLVFFIVFIPYSPFLLYSIPLFPFIGKLLRFNITTTLSRNVFNVVSIAFLVWSFSICWCEYRGFPISTETL